MKKKKDTCEYKDCNQPAKYRVYEFFENGTKKWLHICDLHEKSIFIKSSNLRIKYPDTKFTEVK